jgi:hypothetical protein
MVGATARDVVGIAETVNAPAGSVEHPTEEDPRAHAGVRQHIPTVDGSGETEAATTRPHGMDAPGDRGMACTDRLVVGHAATAG